MDPTADGTATFHWADYLVLSVVLAISGAIGIYYGIQQRKHNTMDEFLVAGRSMSVVPVSISLFVSWMSAISFLSDPVEVYYYGGIYWTMLIGYVLAIPVVAHVFAPVYHKMQKISVYQILSDKYSPQLSLYVIVVGLIASAVFMGIALYAPSLAVSQMTGLDVTWCIVVLGGICTFYTSVGGMKAVLWTDTVQMFVMFGGMVACIVESTRAVGSLGRVWDIADETKRLNFNNFDPNPLARATFWTFVIGGFFRILGPYIAQQHNIQRYVSLKTKKQLITALYLNIPMFMVFTSMYALTGLVMYAYFHECDPLFSGQIAAVDQMLPLMVMETLRSYPGIPGLFLAALCSAALSTISSNLSAFTAIFMSDLVLPLYKRRTGKIMSSKLAIIAAIFSSVVNGAGNIGMAFLIGEIKNVSIFTLTNVAFGGVGAPLTGIYFLMIVFPWVSSWSTFLGSFVSLGISLWFGFGALLDAPPPRDILYISIDGCPGPNSTTDSLFSQDQTLFMSSDDSGFQINELYRLSPPLYAGFGMVMTIIFALIIEGFKSN